MAGLKYWYEFNGRDGWDNRVEIYDTQAVDIVTEEVSATDAPFILEYPAVKKLEPIQGCGATFHMIDDSQPAGTEVWLKYTDLYTSDPQRFRVTHYRRKPGEVEWKINWMGYLNSELYQERLSDAWNYPVEFQATDLGVMDSILYRPDSGGKFTGMLTLWEHLKNCFDLLGLPFNYLNIFSSTFPAEVQSDDTKTILHYCYVSADNFYDEEGDPMTCAEVVKSILEPFALSMVQRDGDIFIYDYDWLMSENGYMRRYSFPDLTYVDSAYPYINYGEVLDRGTISTNGDYEFDDPINNVEIVSSIYASADKFDFRVTKDNLYGASAKRNLDGDVNKYQERYEKCSGWEDVVLGPDYEDVEDKNFHFFKNIEDGATKVGFRVSGDYYGRGGAPAHTMVPTDVTFLSKEYIIGTPSAEGKDYTFNIDALPWWGYQKNSIGPKNIFEEGKKGSPTDGQTGVVGVKIVCRLSLKDSSGNILASLITYDDGHSEWGVGLTQSFPMYFPIASHFKTDGHAGGGSRDCRTNKWMVGQIGAVNQQDKPCKIPSPPVSGYLELKIYSFGFWGVHGGSDLWVNTDYWEWLAIDRILGLYINNLRITANDEENDILSVDNTTFKSYIDKKAKSEYKTTLNVVSVRKPKTALGRANLLGNVIIPGGTVFAPLTKFNRGLEQNRLVEELLLCTIHSNFTGRFAKFSVDINGEDKGEFPVSCRNPMCCFMQYSPVLSGKFLVNGCSINYNTAAVTIHAIGASVDNKSLSTTPYGQ